MAFACLGFSDAGLLPPSWPTERSPWAVRCLLWARVCAVLYLRRAAYPPARGCLAAVSHDQFLTTSLRSERPPCGCVSAKRLLRRLGNLCWKAANSDRRTVEAVVRCTAASCGCGVQVGAARPASYEQLKAAAERHNLDLQQLLADARRRGVQIDEP